MTLARRHFLRVSSAEASASAEEGEPINANAYELQLAKLYEDKRRLKDVKSIERKIEVKRQILPDYAPWIDGVLEAGRGGQDAVLMTVMVWRIDTGDFEGALKIAAYALQHKLVLPDQYKRDVATLVVEEISDQALKDLASGLAAPWLALIEVNALTDQHDIPDQVRAKLFKASGLEMLRLFDDPATNASDTPYRARSALDLLLRAFQLNEKIGVKKEIERLERFIKNNPGTDAADAQASGVGRDTEQAQSNAAEHGASGESTNTDPPGAPAPAT